MKTLFDEPQNEHEKQLDSDEITCLIVSALAKHYDLIEIKRMLLAKQVRAPESHIKATLKLIKTGYNAELAELAEQQYLLTIKEIIKIAFETENLNAALNASKELRDFSKLRQTENTTQNVLKIQIID